jgi:FtsH ternary system domain X3-analog
MAEMLIVLRRDPATGKQNIIVKLDSDPDALPVEHEQLHRTLVEKLIGKGLKPEDLGELIVEREPTKGAAEPAKKEPGTERKKEGTARYEAFSPLPSGERGWG